MVILYAQGVRGILNTLRARSKATLDQNFAVGLLGQPRNIAPPPFNGSNGLVAYHSAMISLRVNCQYFGLLK